ncbi:TetR/AcrR family transcriptional regulator [Subtercola endophyticus]|uniref:TetR/AcrR family transcriptional regulator n=1 Tax=Subtercola endophyticus TaxID=2895559 RepID=UPI001E47EE39|nr:TetR/AcrR family transcriptional regulator [Subtercola endophyticus]UFS58187.1 TetR/AcrR family transcriptional regulator [Subtercola endophyticus]
MPQGLTKKGAATRQRIIEGAAVVVRDVGVANTGLEQIRSVTETSGSQLFHYFPDGKSQILLAVAEFEAGQILDEQQPELSNLETVEGWNVWSDKLFANYERQGAHCALSALMGQLDPNDPAVQRIIVDMYNTWEHALANGVRALQKGGEARADLDPEVAASSLLAGIQGGVLMMLATGTTKNLQAALDSGVGSITRP